MEVDMLGDSDDYEPLYDLSDEDRSSDNESRHQNYFAATAQKRKPRSPQSEFGHSTAKKPRLHEAQSLASTAPVDRTKQIPVEIWQRILTFLPPKDLGRLLSVNKLFHRCLNPSLVANPPYSSVASIPNLLPLKPDAIWRASRRLFWPRMPAPLRGKSELDMWRLACSSSCQFCTFKRGWVSHLIGEQWRRGPGVQCVSSIFAFSVVSCGMCLVERSIKERSIIELSPDLKRLLPALPVILVTDELHVVSPQALQNETAEFQPALTKLVWRDHLELIKAEFEAVNLLGSAAAEEWIKGLETRGREALADASRWEKWDMAGGLYQMRTSSASAVQQSSELDTVSLSGNLVDNGPVVSTGHGIPGLTTLGETSSPRPRPQGQQKRTREEAAELKVMRKSEIERRAMLLEPPIPPKVLAHMHSFQAALQITTPLDDKAWEMLKPRLLAQRKEAELRVNENIATTRALEAVRRDTTIGENSREVTNEDWDDAQGPLRGRISSFADEIIGEAWEHGDKVTSKNSPQFAAEVLVYVRKRFYSEVVKDAAAAVAAGNQPIVDPPEGPWTQKLTLENMKWVFDFKIRVHTEKLRRELFLCHDCQDSSKFYGFEAVIQHYAAKHTDALSAGNIVVHWRAEWPEKPPFNPEPLSPSQSTKKPTGYRSSAESQPQPVATTYPASTSMTYPATYPFSAAPATSAVPSAQWSYDPSSYYAASANPYNAAAYSAYYYGTQPYPYYLWNQQGPPYGAPVSTGGAVGHSPYEHGASTWPNFSAQFPYTQDPTEIQASGEPGASEDNHQPKASYKSQLNVMAKLARSVWKDLSAVQGLPSPIKGCIVVHNIAKRFQQEYSEAASLPMFLDAMRHQPAMRPIQKSPGITCKACIMAEVSGAEEKAFSFLDLTYHFDIKHVQNRTSEGLEPLDWRVDMIMLPDLPTIRNLTVLAESSGPVLRLFKDALPWAFDEDFMSASAAQSNGPPPPASAIVPHDEPESESDDGYEPPGPEYGNSTIDPRTPQPTSQDRHPSPRRQDSARKPHSHERIQVSPPRQTLRPEIPRLRPASEVYSRKRTAKSQSARHPLNPPAATQDSPLRSTQETTKHAQYVQPSPKRFLDQEVPSHHAPVSVRVEPDHMPEPRVERPQRIKQEHAGLYHGEGAEPIPREVAGTSKPAPYPSENRGPGGNGVPAIPPLEHRHERYEENVIYVDESGRELRKLAGGRYVYCDEPPLEPRRPFTPRYDRHEHEGFHERYPPPHYPMYSRREPDYPVQHGRYGGSPPIKEYEIVEVRDPQGDYMIRRPVRRDERDYYEYESRPRLGEPVVYYPPEPRFVAHREDIRGDHAPDLRLAHREQPRDYHVVESIPRRHDPVRTYPAEPPLRPSEIREVREYYPPEHSYPAQRPTQYSAYLPADEERRQRPVRYSGPREHSVAAPRPPPLESEYEDYDPRYPTTGRNPPPRGWY